MSAIITRELIQEAIRLTKPSALAILQTEGMTWGPKTVVGYIEAGTMEDRMLYSFHGEDIDEEWDPEWGDYGKYMHIAMKKVDLTTKFGVNTSVIADSCPGQLEEGDFLYPGGAYREGIGGASASGAKGRADEAIAEILLVNINMLVQLEKDRRIKVDQMEI